MRDKYWNMMTNYKFALYYLDEHFGFYTKCDRIINIILAVASSTAIANWIIWEQFEFVWAFIIAISQALAVINRFLPYRKRVKEISELRIKLSAIYYDIEHKWYDVNYDKISEEEVNDLYYAFTKEWAKSDDLYFLDDALPEKQKMYIRADEKTKIYFNKFF